MSVLDHPHVVPDGVAREVAAAPPSRPPLTQEPARSGTSNFGVVVLGILLITSGVVFLLRPAFPAEWWYYGWSVFVLLPGLVLFLTMAVGGRAMAWLAVPASVVTMTGIILFFQNTFNAWQSWAYAW